jgi:uncharacterized protein
LAEKGVGRAGERGRVARAAWLACGLVLVGIGLVGVILPLLPSTDFFLLALFCFARSSARLEAWLLNHPRLGPPLVAWRTQRAIPLHAKLAAWTGMTISYALLLIFAHPAPLVALAVAGVLLCSALWIASRPVPAIDADV